MPCQLTWMIMPHILQSSTVVDNHDSQPTIFNWRGLSGLISYDLQLTCMIMPHILQSSTDTDNHVSYPTIFHRMQQYIYWYVSVPQCKDVKNSCVSSSLIKSFQLLQCSTFNVFITKPKTVNCIFFWCLWQAVIVPLLFINYWENFGCTEPFSALFCEATFVWLQGVYFPCVSQICVASRGLLFFFKPCLNLDWVIAE